MKKKVGGKNGKMTEMLINKMKSEKKDICLLEDFCLKAFLISEDARYRPGKIIGVEDQEGRV